MAGKAFPQEFPRERYIRSEFVSLTYTHAHNTRQARDSRRSLRRTSTMCARCASMTSPTTATSASFSAISSSARASSTTTSSIGLFSNTRRASSPRDLRAKLVNRHPPLTARHSHLLIGHGKKLVAPCEPAFWS